MFNFFDKTWNLILISDEYYELCRSDFNGGTGFGPGGTGPHGRYPLGPDGRPIGPDGRPLPIGPDGLPIGPDGRPVGPDGRPLGPDGRPLGPGGVPLGPDGRPYPIGPDGRPLGPDGRPLPLGPDGRPIGPDGRPIGPDGRPLGPDGRPYGPDGRPLGPDGYPIPGYPGFGPGSPGYYGNGTTTGSGPSLVIDPLTGKPIEIDECELMGHMMCKNGRCINTMGSFKCECNPGFRYDDPSHMCVGKCLLNFTSLITQFSVALNSHSHLEMKCFSMYSISDIDECTEINPCFGFAKCENTIGSYSCSCPVGYQLNRATNDCIGMFYCS